MDMSRLIGKQGPGNVSVLEGPSRELRLSVSSQPTLDNPDDSTDFGPPPGEGLLESQLCTAYRHALFTQGKEGVLFNEIVFDRKELGCPSANVTWARDRGNKKKGRDHGGGGGEA